MRFPNNPLHYVTLNVLEVEPNLSPLDFGLYSEPSVDKVMLELFGAIFGIRAVKPDSQARH